MNSQKFLEISKTRDCGFISASSTDASKQENEVKNKKLEKMVTGIGYHVAKAISKQRDEPDALFVVDMHQKGNLKDVLTKFARAFKQNSAIFLPHGEKGQIDGSAPTNKYDVDTNHPLRITILKNGGTIEDVLEKSPCFTSRFSFSTLHSFSGFSAVLKKSEAIKEAIQCGIDLNEYQADGSWRSENYPLDDSSLTEEGKWQAKREQIFQMIDNIDILLRNFDLIVSRPRWYKTPLYDCYSGSTITGTQYLSCGQLLQLWKDGRWIEKCSCGGMVYITNTGGSTFSGAGSSWGLCDRCRESQSEFRPFHRYFGAVRTLPRNNIPSYMKVESVEEIIRQLAFMEK